MGGLYTWRCVEAASEEAAVELAVAAVKRDPEWQRTVHGEAESPPVLRAETVAELTGSAALDARDTACVFYIDT